jgi:hypothetical protein
MVETAREVGGAVGVAIVATVAVGHTNDVLASLGGSEEAIPVSLTAGFERGSLVAAGFAIAAALAAGLLLRPAEHATRPAPAQAGGRRAMEAVGSD